MSLIVSVGNSASPSLRRCALLLFVSLVPSDLAVGDGLRIERSVIVQGDAQWDWTQARTTFVPGEESFFVTTMSRTAKLGAHGYHDVYATFSTTRGESWTQPAMIPSLRRSPQADGYEVVGGDLWPSFLNAYQKVLITGKTFNFAEGTKEDFLREKVAYAVMDARTRTCGPLRTVALPDRDHAGNPIVAPNAGCHQPVILDSGEILLPIRYQRSGERRNYTSIVAKCKFDGDQLHYVDHGTEHNDPAKRGLYEPSLIEYQSQFFLTLRADDGAFVAKSHDGIHFTPHIPWRFDTGAPLGSYNTQHHWAAIGGQLYLIYTRRGANNDHIMRHRAPLFIARVDPETLQVVQSSEQILVPQNHATLGNSGVCQLSPDETWITVAEGRVSNGPRKGEFNRVILAKVLAK